MIVLGIRVCLMSKNSMSSNKTVLLLSLLVVVTLCQLQTVFTASFSLETDGQTFGDIDEVVVNEVCITFSLRCLCYGIIVLYYIVL